LGSSRLLDRIATLNFNVIRCANEHPLKAQKYLNSGKVQVVISPNLHNLICDHATERNVVKALKEQFIGRLCEQDTSQIGFFKYQINYQDFNFSWVIQAVQKSNPCKLSEDIFSTKSNVYFLIITIDGLEKFYRNRIQKIKAI
jgi:hypothetical protein